MNLAYESQISSRPTTIISSLIISVELLSLSTPTALAVLHISMLPVNSDTNGEVMRTLLLFRNFGIESYYWNFLNHPSRCGIL